MGIRNSDETINKAVRVGFMPPSLVDAARELDPNFIGSYRADGTKDNFPGEPAYTSVEDFEYINAMDPNPPYEAIDYTPPAKADVLAKWQELFAAYEPKAVYSLQRQTEYPQLGEQLDALFHDLEAGTLTLDGKFASLIKEVKDTYPKA